MQLAYARIAYITASRGKIARGEISALSFAFTSLFFILTASILPCTSRVLHAHLRTLLSVFQIIVEFHQPINVAHPPGVRENARLMKVERALFFGFPF